MYMLIYAAFNYEAVIHCHEIAAMFLISVSFHMCV